MTIYIIIAVFVFGMFVGSAKETEEKPCWIQWCFLVLIAACWPWMVFIIWKEWMEKRP